jgi:Novel STAND NTPase 3
MVGDRARGAEAALRESGGSLELRRLAGMFPAKPRSPNSERRCVSIAIIAPTKFDFQDLACVELGLRWPTDGAPSLRAEPHNGEDAELAWTEAGRRRLCEIQVKGRTTGEIDMATLAEYLAHFPDRQAQGCLLDRLIENPEQVVLFVASERCRDAVARYRAPPEWTGAFRNSRPDPAAGNALAAALGHLSQASARVRTKEPTRLKAQRAAHLGALAASDPDQFAAALERVFIHEQETPATITVRLHQKLSDFGVPTDRLADGVARLKQVVAEDRAARVDVFAKLHTVLADFAPERMARPKYLPRGIEDELADCLAQKKALLLSGPPRAGKSWTAMQIADGLQKQGYEVLRSGHIDQAERFLNDPVRRQRAYILEDPLGARQAVTDASARVAELQRLLDSLPVDRRLIVAQSDAPILQTFRENDLAKCGLGAFAWTVLPPLPTAQAEALWRRDAVDAGVAPVDVDRVSCIVNSNEELRDAGAIAYLATNFDRLRDGVSDAEIIAHARGDAVDFARVLAEESAVVGDVLRGVAVATEAGLGVMETELAFVTDGGDDRPSFDQSMGITLSAAAQPVTPPTYAAPPVLAAASRDAVTLLRRRRVLELQDARHNFVHPYLRAGAQAVFRPDLEEDVACAEAYTQRALAAVDPKVSLAAARNLHWVASALEVRDGGLLRAVALAEDGLRSLYPATRDACFHFLTSRASDLPQDEQRRLNRWVQAVDVSFDQVEEAAGVLLVSSGLPAILGRETVPLSDVQPYVNAIEAEQPLDLDSSLAFAIILAFAQNGRDLSPRVVERLLSADAAVLRAAASAQWLERPRDGDDAIVRRITNDSTPAVSNAVLDVLVRNWSELPEPRRDSILGILEAHARSPGSATTLLERLGKFNREEEFGKAPPWAVFTRLAPVALRNVPDAVFRNGRFVLTVNAAVAAGEGERLLPLLEVWATGLAERLATRLPDESELSVTKPMLAVGPAAWRWPLIEDLLDRSNTGARLRMVAFLVDDWAKLAGPEQQSLIQRLQSDGADTDWLRAAALTRGEAPSEILVAFSGRSDLLDLDPAAILAVLGEPLFCACLHVFIGTPQPLWWLGSHHSNSGAWAQAVRWSAGASDRPLFALALEDVISFGEDDELTDLVGQAAADDLSGFFETFLHRKTEENGNWRTRAWVRLLDCGAEAGLIDAWFEEITSAAPLFLDHLRDIRYWLGEGPYGTRLLKALVNDVNAYRRLDVIRQISELDVMISEDEVVEDEADEETAETPTPRKILALSIESLRTTLERAPPCLFGTWDDVRNALKQYEAPPTVLEFVEEKRKEVLKSRSDFRYVSLSAHDPPDSMNWVGPR